MKILPLAKHKKISLEFDAPVFVVGIASNERIWKLCWMVNQALNLNLEVGNEGLSSSRNQGYTDTETDTDFEYQLVEGGLQGKKVPRLARDFRFWLIIRPLREKEPDIPELIAKISEVDIISLAYDLSGIDELKKLLP